MSAWTRNAKTVVTLSEGDVKDNDVKKRRTRRLLNPAGHVISSKVTLVGNMEVGKTSLAMRFCRKTAELNPRATVAADWLHQSVMVDSRRVNLQIWDTAGQEKFLAVVPSFLRSSFGVLLVYDVTDVKSFTSNTMWLDMVKKEAPDATVTLVANKIDKPQRIISTEDGENFAREKGLHYTETSALTGHNVDKVFNDLAERIVNSWVKPENDNEDNIKLTKDVKSKKKCC